MKRELIVFGEDWASLPSSTQHLISHISKQRTVVWINSIGLRKPQLNAYDMLRVIKKLYNSTARFLFSGKKNKNRQQAKVSSDKLFVYNLLSLPAPRYAWERFIAKKLLSAQIKSLIARHKLNHFALWSSLPTASDLIDEFPTTPFIYYCCDDFTGLAGVDHRCAKIHEKKLAKEADLILATSQRLKERFTHSHCHYLTHGVDYELFSKPTAAAQQLPSNGRPTAGFYGSIASWLDLSLLEEVICELSDWNFVFIGSEAIDVSHIKKLKNTYFLGPIEHSKLPSFSQHWQVSLLPFKDNAQIQSCNPLKLKEYLASGTPIVSTPFPSACAYQDQITLVNNAKDMCRAIKRSHQHAAPSAKTQRQDLVKKESWLTKSKQVEYWIDAL
ncbi:glycosyltransferase [Agaribacterium sp. ZY112]|uniref:glycosyltransferase n=1 Tax=Agaribacterium sp. ZY112 TaxID=3233574 RepID=UPI0035246619